MRYIVYYARKGSVRITVEDDDTKGAVCALAIVGRVFNLMAPREGPRQETCAEGEHDGARMWTVTMLRRRDHEPIPLQALEDPCGTESPPRRPCSCIHEHDLFHDPETGACLYTNPVFGPCPCEATPEATRKVLWQAHKRAKDA